MRTTTPTTVLGYARVSTPKQDIAAQEAAMRDYCRHRDGWDLLDVIADEAKSGATLEREGFKRALQRIEAGEADGLIVARLDRVTRSFMDLASVLAWFTECDASLIAIDLGIDTSHPAGRLVANVIGAVAQWERETIGIRTREGLAALRAQGRPTGRPAVADMPEVAARIRDMHAEGMTLSAIARTLNAEGVPTLRGAKQWRASSVQTATGYRRPQKARR